MFLFIFAAIIFTVFSAALLLYVSLSTGLGPWVGPLVAVVIRAFFSQRHSVAYMTIIASLGGAIATGIGFSLTTLYFVDPQSWDFLMTHPLLFCGGMGVVVIVASAWGLGLARRFMPRLSNDATISFPVASAIAQVIDAPAGKHEMYVLGTGTLFSGIVGFVRDVLHGFPGITLLPVCWAVGFLAGASVGLPLLVGMLVKYIFVQPVASYVSTLPYYYFSSLKPLDITFALCTGLLISGLLHSMPKDISLMWRRFKLFLLSGLRSKALGTVLEVGGAFGVGTLLYAFAMPLVAILFVLLFFLPLLEHLAYFAMRTGLATYGRYMTLMMIPLLCMPGVLPLHIVVVCTVIGIAGAVMVDSLCAYKLRRQYQLNELSLYKAQWSGILIAAAGIGVLFWFLCSHFTLGVEPLIAHRGLSRALMMKTFQFNGFFVVLGIGLGYVFSLLRINPALVFGGLIMPTGLVLSLALGGGVRLLTKNTGRATLFWSGVLAGDLLWIVLFLGYMLLW